MKIREHRGGLSDSMKTVVEIEPTLTAIADHINKCWRSQGILSSSITVQKYGTGPDQRIGWDTHIVLVNGNPFGFTDGPCDE